MSGMYKNNKGEIDIVAVMDCDDKAELQKYLDKYQGNSKYINSQLLVTACSFNAINCARLLLTLPNIDPTYNDNEAKKICRELDYAELEDLLSRTL